MYIGLTIFNRRSKRIWIEFKKIKSEALKEGYGQEKERGVAKLCFA